MDYLKRDYWELTNKIGDSGCPVFKRANRKINTSIDWLIKTAEVKARLEVKDNLAEILQKAVIDTTNNDFICIDWDDWKKVVKILNSRD